MKEIGKSGPKMSFIPVTSLTSRSHSHGNVPSPSTASNDSQTAAYPEDCVHHSLACVGVPEDRV